MLIWAQARNAAIGLHNALPWHIPEDLKHFKERTAGHPVIMGRRTWDSLQPPFRPLPGRRNIVLSHDDAWTGSGATRAADLEEALRIAGPGRTYVVGGAQTYRAAMPYADFLDVTEIDADYPGDAYAPEIDPAIWHLAEDGPWQVSAGIRYRFRGYLKRR
ncbi:dihydrofolate reductase [Skermania piniformis]